MATKNPNPIDKHIGQRVRMRRMMLGISQEKLGDALNLTFQQVQKYEKGTNRISGSRLVQIARTLDVPVEFLFEGAPTMNRAGIPIVVKDAPPEYVHEFLSTMEGHATAKAMMRITNTKMRRRFLDLLEQAAEMFPISPAGRAQHVSR